MSEAASSDGQGEAPGEDARWDEHKRCNVSLPVDLVEELKAEAHELTGHRRRGFSDLVAICVRCGWEAYQRGDLNIGRRPKVVAYKIVPADD